MKNKFICERGFSLVELITVISILSIALIAIAGLITQNIHVNRVNQNLLTASMLAQEGLELIRNARDNNWVRGATSTTWKLGGCPDCANLVKDLHYTIDYTGTSSIDDTVVDINSDEARLYFDNATGFYDHDNSGAATIFRRIILATPTAFDYKLEITCLVQWLDRGSPKQYQADMVLYDWR